MPLGRMMIQDRAGDVVRDPLGIIQAFPTDNAVPLCLEGELQRASETCIRSNDEDFGHGDDFVYPATLVAPGLCGLVTDQVTTQPIDRASLIIRISSARFLACILAIKVAR